MKTAQEIRAGNTIMVDGSPRVVLKTEYSGSVENSDTVRMKTKNLLTGFESESVFSAGDKIDLIILDKRAVTYSYFADPEYKFMDCEYNQFDIAAENMGEALNYLEDGMPCEVTFYDGKAISVELPTALVREVTRIEQSVKGNASGKLLKSAYLTTGFKVEVPLFVEVGDMIEIDTRAGEYRARK